VVIVVSLLSYKFYEDIPFISNLIIEYEIGIIRKKLKQEPYSIELHYRLSQIYFKKGEINKYEEKLKLLSKLSPESFLYAVKLGDHFFKTNQYKLAIRAYNDALSLNKGKDILLHFKIGNAYTNLNMRQKAIEEYRIQIKILEDMDDDDKTEKMIKFIREIIDSIQRRNSIGE
jgi:tetratricopeptide (TPR) repeat protein